MESITVNYWERRYLNEGQIWGLKESRTLRLFAWWLQEMNCKHVLVVGCGYGRSVHYLRNLGFQVDAVDTSETAISMLRAEITDSKAWVEDAVYLESVPDSTYDAVIADKLLHLLSPDDRMLAVQTWTRIVRTEGIILCSAFSIEDDSYETGEKIGNQTWKLPDGKRVYYFDDQEWKMIWDHLFLHSNGTIEERYPGVRLLFHFVVAEVKGNKNE